MKKELNARYWLLLLIMFVCNSLRANDVVFVAGTDVSQTLSITKDGITIALSNGTLSRSDNYRPYANSTTTVSSTVGNITKVVFTCTTSGSSNYSPNSYDKNSVSSGTYSYSGYDGIWTGDAASFSINAKSLVRITKIVVTYNPSETTEPDITYNGEDSYELVIGSEFTEPTFVIASEGVSLSYQSDNTAVASVDSFTGEVSINGVGTATITASFVGNDTYSSWTKSYTITVTAEPLTGETYTLVTDVEDLKAGDNVIVVNTEASKAMSTTQNNYNRGATEVIIYDTDIIVPASTDIQVFTLEGNSDGWYFYTGSGYIYAASGSSNWLRTEAEKDDNAKATINIDDYSNATITFQGTNNRNVLQYNPNTNNNNPIFSCYGSATQKPVSIFVLKDGKQEADLSFSEESVTVDLGEIEDFVSPIFNNPHDLAVTATSTNENVAVFDVETSQIVLKGSDGTAEITVTSDATDEYRKGKASITVTTKKSDTAVSFEKSVVEITYGDNYDKQKAKAEGYSGNLVYMSSNESIVKFHGNSVIDVLGPGTVTIKAIAPATETTSESSATYLLKIYAPADGVEGEEALLNEMFDDCTGSRPADNPDDNGWNGTNDFKTLPETCNWTVAGTAEPAGNGCLKLGTSTKAGDATSPSFTLKGTSLLQFDIAPWTSTADGTITGAKSVTITLTNATFEDGETTKTVGAAANASFTIGWNHFEYNIIGSGEGDVTINFHGSSQFFLDNVVVGGGAQPAHEINLTFSSAGYLTWVATANIDFSQTEGVTAYQITEATSKKITMEEVDKVPAGAAVMLKGSGTKTLKRTTEEVADLSDNKMLACTDGSVTGNGNGVTNTDVYVLGNGKSGLGFYMLKGTLQAGKGYLKVSEEGNAKDFIGFEITTGLKTIEIKDDDDAAIYNLQGIRVAHPQKGIYVKNGKKYVIK